MKDIDLNGKCGSCYYFHLIEGTANGECHKFPYGDDVVHDAAHPFFQPGRSRIKCKNYRTTPITNADRIRSMTDEELDKFLGEVQWDVANYCGGVTQKQEYPVPEQRGAWLNWLKEEASDGD